MPDAPARAWRAADGSVRLLAAHTRARILSGPSLNELHHACRIVFQSAKRDDPARFDDMGWLTSPYTLDGTTIYGLVHNEYHGHKRRDLCPTGDYMACWWNALTLTVSHDGGQSFGPARYVAGVPYRFRGDREAGRAVRAEQHRRARRLVLRHGLRRGHRRTEARRLPDATPQPRASGPRAGGGGVGAGAGGGGGGG
ncbi:hypothetical protein GAY28_37970, partial [Azospirillum brasilense]|nr:hypothetical protein [Azospirillum brasilense]